ncbi:LacI family DNA-binding transcriptional regulator [Pontiella sp.]|uniref:LacI family DNA-binding transcriptional regulator n=1 Tax=Pontiella sp. TaxID=2837462 RepID=UPI00356919D0
MNKNPGRRISLRDIAGELGISHVTVSRALRNMQNVAPELKARIQSKADEMGYTPDPLLASLSRYSKTGGSKSIQAELAWMNVWDPPEQLRQHREFELYWKGASDNAERTGYRLEEFNMAEIPPSRLKAILRARNIQGIMLPPLGKPTTLLDTFDWSDFAVVRFGQAIRQPEVHIVGSSQQENAMLAFDRIHQLGYQRIGCVCQYSRMRFFGSGYIWAQRELPTNRQLPLLTKNTAHSFQQNQRELDAWLRRHKPDAIFTDDTEVRNMLINLGYSIPHDIALATTSIHDTDIDTGLDQRPYEIGWAATRMLTALINEKSFGIPECQSELLIEGIWVDSSMMPKKQMERRAPGSEK